MTQYGKSRHREDQGRSRAVDPRPEPTVRQIGEQRSAQRHNPAGQHLENIAYVESRKARMTAEMYQQAMVLARAKPIQSAVQSYVANGNWDQPEAIMADPASRQSCSRPSVARPADGRHRREGASRRPRVKRQGHERPAVPDAPGARVDPEETIKARSFARGHDPRR